MKKSVNTSNSKIGWLIAGIVLFVLALTLVMIFVQQSYSNKVKKVTIAVTDGSASPEFRQSTQIVLTSTGCQLTRTKAQPVQTQTTDCPMDKNTFDKIQASINNYAVVDKIIAHGNLNELSGNKQTTITIELQNGISFTAQMSQQFIQNLGPFFEEIQLLVPTVEQIIPIQ